MPWQATEFSGGGGAVCSRLFSSVWLLLAWLAKVPVGSSVDP